MKQSTELALLDIERHYDASRESVFAALTQPELMNQWFVGNPDGYAKVEQDFRVGGKYVVNMYDPDGKEHQCEADSEARHAPHGEYLEIDPPRKLVFSWISEGFVDDSTVTILLEETDGGTKLTLRHSLPPQTVDAHREGWNACLDHLADFLRRS